MDAGSNESNSEKLKPGKNGRGHHVTGKGKLKSIRNKIYLYLRRIDSRLWDNRLVQILEIDQSIDCPHKILRGVLAQVFLRCLLSPAGGVLSIDLQIEQGN
jgi:hypothetical protein